MIFVKGIIALIALFIVPELIGLFITYFFNKEKGNVILSFILGYLFELALCQILTIPFIYAKAKFTTLEFVFWGILTIISIASLIINRKRFKDIFKELFNNLKKAPKVLLIITVILIALQLYALIVYSHGDDDDAFYVATATTSVQTNTIFKYAAQDGEDYGDNLPLRYVLGPFPVYVALLSNIVQVHPAIFAHCAMPILFIPIVYMVYYLLGEFLFNENKKHSMLFVILLCILNVWGNYSSRTNFSFLLFRIWQGKAILANLILPSIWLMFLMAEKNEFKLWNCLCMLITVLAGTLTTTMGIAFPPIIIACLAFLYLLKTKNLKNAFKICLTAIPCAIYGLLYVIL